MTFNLQGSHLVPSNGAERWIRRGLTLCCATALLWSASCAPRRSYAPAPVPDWEVVERTHLEAPSELSARERRSFQEGWMFLQHGRLEAAASELEGLARRHPRNAEIATALGFLELRLGNRAGAEDYFRTALSERSDFAPAQSGHFLLALASGDDEEAYRHLLRLREASPQHPLVERHETSLQVNVAEERLRAARQWMEQQRYAEAAEAYARALEAAPHAGGLYLETAEAELAAGHRERAIEHAERAVELEPNNVAGYRVLGDALYASGELEQAVEAYRKASSLRPGDEELRARLEAVDAEYREKILPPEYTRIHEAKRLTRAQLAALIYLEFRKAFEELSADRRVIATDIRDSWAFDYIRRVVGAGILEVFSDYSFQPKGFVTRMDLARALAKALERLAPEVYEAAKQSSRFRQDFPDLSEENLNYEAAAMAVSLGLLLTGEGGAFEPQKFVSGAEAVAAVDALAAHMTP